MVDNMRFSRTYKGQTTRKGLIVVTDVTAGDLKRLKIPYILCHRGYN